MMIRSLTLPIALFALLGMTPGASAYFAEDFLFPSPATPAEALPEESIAVTPVVLPAPDAVLSRALFTAKLVEERYAPATIKQCYWDIASSVPPQFTQVFSDVATDHPYARHLCIALRDGLIHGYGDGTFRPDQPITAAEASRILARAANLTPYADATHYDRWYEPYVWELSQRNAIPLQIESLSQPLSVSAMQEMTVRITENITDKPARSYRSLVAPTAERIEVRNVCTHDSCR